MRRWSDRKCGAIARRHDDNHLNDSAASATSCRRFGRAVARQSADLARSRARNSRNSAVIGYRPVELDARRALPYTLSMKLVAAIFFPVVLVGVGVSGGASLGGQQIIRNRPFLG